MPCDERGFWHLRVLGVSQDRVDPDVGISARRASDNRGVIRMHGVVFEVDLKEHTLEVAPPADLEPDSLGFLYINRVAPLLLSLHSSAVLHGSAVSFGSETVCFIGETGVGKSTLAKAALMHADLQAELVTDDTVVVCAKGSELLVAPGPAEVRLWEDSLSRLHDPSLGQPRRAWQSSRKVRVEVPRNNSGFTRLSALFFIDESASPCCVAVPPSEAVVRLSSHTFRFDDASPKERRRELSLLSEIVSETQCWALGFSDSYDSLAEVLDLVIERTESDAERESL